MLRSINHPIKIKTSLREGESRTLTMLWLGEGDLKIDIDAILDRPGSSLKLLGIFFGRSHHLELRTNVTHRAPHTFSRTIIRAALDGNASANFEGNVTIEKGAKNADGDIRKHAILLSPGAIATAKPSLAILENEVKAGHAATISRIDENQIFYIMSRGLSLDAAKRIIIQGFLGSLLAEFPKKEAAKAAVILGL